MTWQVWLGKVKCHGVIQKCNDIYKSIKYIYKIYKRYLKKYLWIIHNILKNIYTLFIIFNT